jgi:hypothetical protein
MVLSVSDTLPPSADWPLKADLHDYLETNDDVVPRTIKPAKTAHSPAPIGRSEQPIALPQIVDELGFRLSYHLAEHYPLHARALRVRQ